MRGREQKSGKLLIGTGVSRRDYLSQIQGNFLDKGDVLCAVVSMTVSKFLNYPH